MCNINWSVRNTLDLCHQSNSNLQCNITWLWMGKVICNQNHCFGYIFSSFRFHPIVKHWLFHSSCREFASKLKEMSNKIVRSKTVSWRSWWRWKDKQQTKSLSCVKYSSNITTKYGNSKWQCYNSNIEYCMDKSRYCTCWSCKLVVHAPQL
jgi:hypothetical protein